jgi:hypothetical protein
MRKVRGYDIDIQHTGQNWLERDIQHVWAPEGELPDEWGQITQDPNTVAAKIAPSSQRRIRGDKRRYIDEYSISDDDEE